MCEYTPYWPASIAGSDVVAVWAGAPTESVEAGFFELLVTRSSTDVRDRLGITWARIGGGVVTSVVNDVTGYWCCAVGLGVSEPVTTSIVDDVIDLHTERNTGVRFLIAPHLLPGDWPDICARHGLREGGEVFKLACRIDDFRNVGRSEFRVGRAPDPLLWSRFTLRGFGMPDGDLADMISGGVGSQNYHPFAAWAGDVMIAGGGLLVQDGAGHLSCGSTLFDYRSRGAQSALIAARAGVAAAAGCRWLVAEATVPKAGERNPSLENLLRSGLQIVYPRTSWVWRPRAAPSTGAPE